MKMVTSTGLLIGTSGLILICLAYWFVCSHFFVVSSVVFNFDSYISTELKQIITQQANKLFLGKPFTQLALDELKKNFSTVRKIEIGYAYPHTARCHVYSHQPLLFINNVLLLAHGGIVEQIACNNNVLTSLPHVMMKNQHDLYVPFFLTFFKTSPSWLFDYFTVTWIDHTVIELQDKNNQMFTLVGHYQLIFDEKLQKQYQQIKQQILVQKNGSKKKWLIDMRFKNQIIITQRDMGSL